MSSELSPEEPSIIPIGKSQNSEAGLAPLLLTVIELVRQLMEAQVIRRMDAEMLSDEELDRAAESLRQLEEQVIKLCEVFDIDPEDLNLDLGEIGTLLPKSGEYYPGEKSESPSVLELLDRILNTGVVLDGSLDLGLAELSLIHARLQLVLTSKPISQSYRSQESE
ncbi:gas vesicle protein K [Dapis sp. BLCC M126]|uniref:gas vesicle protein K n=1 Tax=Dapis sp. BLCC M126 TaxID=3400189 RepID=UPI003CE81C12